MKREDLQKCLLEIAENLPDEISTNGIQAFQTRGEDLNGKPQPVVIVLNFTFNQINNNIGGDYCMVQTNLSGDNCNNCQSCNR